jgi:hypothetical protein
MLMHGLRQITNEDTEFALLVDFHLQEIIIVSATATSVPPNSSQANAKQTGSVTDNGTKQLQPADTFNPAANPVQ